METCRLLNIDIQSVRKSDLLYSLHEGVLFTPNMDHNCLKSRKEIGIQVL